MKNPNLAEELKNKRQIAEFRRKGHKGRMAARLTRRQRALYKEHGDDWAKVGDLPAAVRQAYLIRGHYSDKSAHDLKADHVALVRANLLEWRPEGEESADGLTVRVPCEHEHNHGRKLDEHEWCASGFIVEDDGNRWTPYRPTGLTVQAVKRPDGRCKCASVYDCLPQDHGVRPEDIEMTTEARQHYPTPGSVFAACMELHQLGCVKVEPLGLDV